MHIWLLSGYAGSGKDTVAAMMLEILESAASNGFADAVKDEVAAMYDLTRESLDTQAGKARMLLFADGTKYTVRDLLIEHAETTKKGEGSAIWAQRIQAPNTTHWILSDWRFLAEYETIKARFPDTYIHTVRIRRPSVHPLDTYTEHELDTFAFEYTIENTDSLLYLRNQVLTMLTPVRHVQQAHRS
jgi:hypothetical protein